MNKVTMQYRPEIDGLRALAVLAVIVFHLNSSWLQGGFLGVDIFFVISGYLITNIINTKLQTNSFSYKDFYTRRIKRIYPVFIFVLALASIFSVLFFTRNESELLRKTVETAVMFFSNFYIATRLGYWDMQTIENPLNHIWSLAVEEQYYLFFPWFLVWCYKKTAHLENNRAKKILNYTWILFGLMILATFIPNYVYDKFRFYNNYYLSNLRFPELLVGSILALSNFKLPNKTGAVASIVALIGLGVCLVFFSKDLPFTPGIMMLIPCSLTAMLIWSMQGDINQSINPVKQFFSLKPVVFIGKISYSLYLFHWFFIALTHFITGQQVLNNSQILIIVLLTFASSIASFYWLETPLRHSKFNFKQTFLWLYFVPSITLIGFNLTMKPLVIVKREHQLINSAYGEKPDFIVSKAKIAVIGDSHAEHLMKGFMQTVGNKEGWRADSIKYPFDDCYLHSPRAKPNPQCNNPTALVKDYPIIVVSIFYNARRNVNPVPREARESYMAKDFNTDFVRMIEDLARNHQVIVMGDIKNFTRSPVRASIMRLYGLDQFLEPIKELIDMDKYNAEIKAMVSNIPNVKFVDPSKYLPNSPYFEGNPLYIDQDHLNNFGSTLMGKGFIQHERLLTPEEVKKLYP